MSEYLTKKEATDFLGKSIAYLNKYIVNGEIPSILDPKDLKRKLLLASDVYKIKAEKDKAKADKQNKKTRQMEQKRLEKEYCKQDPKDMEIKAVRLDLLDAVTPYKVSVQKLYLYEAEVMAVAELSENERKEAFKDLVHRVIKDHKASHKEDLHG